MDATGGGQLTMGLHTVGNSQRQMVSVFVIVVLERV
jgi:hypothetical protein